MQNYKKVRQVLHSVKRSRPVTSQNHLVLLSRANHFLVRLLKKFERSIRCPSEFARIFLQFRPPLAVRRLHSIVKVHVAQQFISNDFSILGENPRNDGSYQCRVVHFAIGRDDAEARCLSRPIDSVFVRLAGPRPSARTYSDNSAAVPRDLAVRPVPLVFLESSHPLNEAGIPAEVGKEERRTSGREIPQPRISPPDLAPEQVTSLTDQVLQSIDRRIVAQRERWGRV